MGQFSQYSNRLFIPKTFLFFLWSSCTGAFGLIGSKGDKGEKGLPGLDGDRGFVGDLGEDGLKVKRFFPRQQQLQPLIRLHFFKTWYKEGVPPGRTVLNCAACTSKSTSRITKQTTSEFPFLSVTRLVVDLQMKNSV